jgi:hypothetical protein
MSDHTVIVVAIAVVGFVMLKAMVKAWARKRRRDDLIARFGVEIADLIISRSVWEGMTEEQLNESIGKPAQADRKILRSKDVKTLKFGQTGKNRFAMRVTVENGLVVGWTQYGAR